MSATETLQISSSLPSVYDPEVFNEADFIAERDRVHEATAIERDWMNRTGIEPFSTDADILRAADKGQVVRVGHGAGYIAIERLLQWSPERSNPKHPEHKWHYSSPYLRPVAARFLEDLGAAWQDDMGPSRFLSVASLGRSTEYQSGLRTQYRKLTIVNEDDLSSHQGLIALDIDGCGLNEIDDNGNIRKINPRYPEWNPILVTEGRTVLRHLLDRAAADGIINYVEELPGTQEHCFHICVNPT